MTDRKPQLTISLLSSGRSKTIERCLSSLAPFKEQLDTEIIVVDTDPEHRQDVHEVLEKYADKIMPFEWINDFSAARNVSIDAARSEWYLFIDDDEWFIDPQPAIEFLLSDNKDKYRWTNFLICNYHDERMKLFSEAWVSRLFRIDGGTRFVGSVHEIPKPVEGGPINIKATLGHTGYIFSNDEERIAHARRNMELLEDLRKKEPREVRWVFQLVQEYRSLKDAESGRKVAAEGYRLMSGGRGYKNACLRGFFAADMMFLEADEKKWDACYGIYKKLKKDNKPIGRVAAAYMEYEAARASNHLGMTRNSQKHCRRYIEAYEKNKDIPTEWAEEWLNFLMYTFEDVKFYLLAAMLIDNEISDGKWEAFEKYFDCLPWDSRVSYDKNGFARRLLEAACSIEFDPHFAHLARILWEMPDTQKIYQDYLRELTDAGDEKRFSLIRAVIESGAKGGKPLDLLIAWDDHKGNREHMPTYFSQLFQITNPLNLEILLWKIGLRRGALLDKCIAEVPLARWSEMIDDFLSNMTDEHICKIADIMDEVYLGMPDNHYNMFLAKTNVRIREIHGKEELKFQEIQKQEAKEKMRHLIDEMQKKVEELIAAGMLDEAEQVMKEIRKYAPE